MNMKKALFFATALHCWSDANYTSDDPLATFRMNSNGYVGFYPILTVTRDQKRLYYGVAVVIDKFDYDNQFWDNLAELFTHD